jgi:hypothetical protein
MVAKVTTPEGKSFFVHDDQFLIRARGYSLLSQETKDSLDDVAMMGTKEGFKVVSIDGQQGGAAFDVTRDKIDFRGASKESWVIFRFEENPPALVLYDGTRIEPATRAEKER